MKGICRICGKNKKLSFEHTPPESSFNSSPVFIQKSEHIHNKNSFVYGKRILSNRGAGSYSLCISCNSSTGGFYGESFKEFTYQGMMTCTFRIWTKEHIPNFYHIKPLNILKQIMTMFMSIDKSDQLLKMKGLSGFILDKNSQNLPQQIRIFLYFTSSISIRNGWSLLHNTNTGKTVKLGEISFRPFGYIYTIDSLPFVKNVFEITNWKNYQYNQKTTLLMELPFLQPKGNVSGLYI